MGASCYRGGNLPPERLVVKPFERPGTALLEAAVGIPERVDRNLALVVAGRPAGVAHVERLIPHAAGEGLGSSAGARLVGLLDGVGRRAVGAHEATESVLALL